MGKLLYKEEQQFRQRWIWGLLIALCVPPLFIAWQLFEMISANSADYLLMAFVLLFYVCIMGALVWLFIRFKLTTEVRTDAICFKFPPLLYKWKTVKKEDIATFEIRKYKPISEFGGWGIKGGFKSKAYTVSGDIGLQLLLKNDKKVLIGTQRAVVIEAAMKKLMADKL